MDTAGRQRRRNDPAGTAKAWPPDRCGRPLESSSLTSSRLTSTRAPAASPRHVAGDPRQLGMRRNKLEVSTTSATKRDEARAAVTGHLDRRRRPWGSSLPPPSSTRRELIIPPPKPISHCRGVPAVPRQAAGDSRQLGMRRNELEVSSTSAAKRDEARAAAVTGHLDRRRRPWGSSLPSPSSTCPELVIPPPKPISHRRGVPTVNRCVARVSPRPRLGRSKLEDLRISAAGSGEARAATGHLNQLCQEILPWLPDDLLVEILSRLPAKPVHRFKCVSKSWHDLISNPNHRKSLPQALAGFICVDDEDRYPAQFINASGRGPPLVDLALAFLPNHTSIVVLDCRNGLLLLGSGLDSDSPPRDYVVCNPATQKWVALPDSGATANFWFSILAFDPAVSSHFHVLGYVGDGAAWIYSSLTGGWSQSHGLGDLTGPSAAVFLNGMLHCRICFRVARAINLETKEWRDIELPDCDDKFPAYLGQSQGCLVVTELDNGGKMSVWTLENYGSGGWILKHSLSWRQHLRRSFPTVFVFHPELNMVFYDDCGQNGREVIKSYNIDRRESRRVAVVTGACRGDWLLLLYVPFFEDMPDVGQSSELN